jgi:hypothetical protein
MRIRSHQHPSEHNLLSTFSLHSYEYTEAGIRFRSRSIGCPVQNILVLVVIRTRATAPVGKSQAEAASRLSGRELEEGPAGGGECRACMTVISEGKARVSSVRLNG